MPRFYSLLSPPPQPPLAPLPSAVDATSLNTSSAPSTEPSIPLVLGCSAVNGLAWAALAAWLSSPVAAVVTWALSAIGTAGTLLFIAGATRE